MRTESSEGEWPVSYHGTGKGPRGNIAQEGNLQIQGRQFLSIEEYSLHHWPTLQPALLPRSNTKERCTKSSFKTELTRLICRSLNVMVLNTGYLRDRRMYVLMVSAAKKCRWYIINFRYTYYL